jgi:hypothetical protein
MPALFGDFLEHCVEVIDGDRVHRMTRMLRSLLYEQ